MIKKIRISLLYRISNYLINNFKNINIIYFAIKITPYWHQYINKVDSSFIKILKDFDKDNKIHKFLLSGTGVLLIFVDKYVYKIAISDIQNISLNQEFKAYALLKKSNLSFLVSYILEKKIAYQTIFYKSDLLESPSNINKDYNSIITTLHEENHKKLLHEVNFHELDAGYKIIKNYLSKDSVKKLDTIFNKIQKTEFSISFMHGDLTPLNIMNYNHNPVLIDLDRFKFEGIAYIDIIHFAVEKKAKEIKKSSFETISIMIDENYNWINDISKSEYQHILLTYFLYKISVESRKDVAITERYSKLMVLTFNSIINKFF